MLEKRKWCEDVAYNRLKGTKPGLEAVFTPNKSTDTVSTSKLPMNIDKSNQPKDTLLAEENDSGNLSDFDGSLALSSGCLAGNCLSRGHHDTAPSSPPPHGISFAF